MAVEKGKIVLDADVIIHFSKGECLSLLPEIFPNYQLERAKVHAWHIADLHQISLVAATCAT